MTSREIQVYNCIKENPGQRKRVYLGMTRMSLNEYLDIEHSLMGQGYIRAVHYSDPANMEYYDKWYISK